MFEFSTPDFITPEFLTLGFFFTALILLFLWWLESRKCRHKCRGIHSLYLFQCKNCHLIFVGENDAKAPAAVKPLSVDNVRSGEEEVASPLSRCPNCRTWCVRQWIEAGRH